MVESRNVSWSIVLHALVLLVAAVGLPALLPKTPDPIPLVMSVELLPISEISNVKPSDQPIQKAQAKPTPTPPKPTPTPPTPKAAPTPPAPTPPPPPKEETFDPDKGAEAKDKIKPVEKKPEPPKPTVDQKQQTDFEKTLEALKQQAEKDKQAAAAAKDAQKSTQNVAENKTKSDAPYDASMPLSISEKDMIRSQFIPCWNNGALAGSKDAHSLAARVKVKLQPDGTVIEGSVALVSDQLGRYNSDPFFRAAADTAMRAVYKCSPLKNLPADKYGSWKDMEINFDPSEL